MLQVEGYITPQQYPGYVAARDEIPTIFIHKYFRRTHASRVSHFLHL